MNFASTERFGPEMATVWGAGRGNISELNEVLAA
jgi:hypothetical protein